MQGITQVSSINTQGTQYTVLKASLKISQQSLLHHTNLNPSQKLGIMALLKRDLSMHMSDLSRHQSNTRHKFKHQSNLKASLKSQGISQDSRHLSNLKASLSLITKALLNY
jgi:hypothetical protein